MATFRKYEGQDTDERDERGRVVKVTAASFARHAGIDRITFSRWVKGIAQNVQPEERIKKDAVRARTEVRRLPPAEKAKLAAELGLLMSAEARKRVEIWIDRIKAARDDKASADAHVDADSLARAADLEAIYADMSWINDMPPIPKRKGRGRRVDPKSREQFAKWVHQTYGWGTKQSLGRFQTAHKLRLDFVTQGYGNGIVPTGERVLRPLARLRAQGYDAQQGQVWAAACEMADGECPTPWQVSRAVSDFLDKLKPAINTAADPRSALEKRAARRARLVAEFDAILAEDNALADDTVKELIRHFNDHQKLLREEKSA